MDPKIHAMKQREAAEATASSIASVDARLTDLEASHGERSDALMSMLEAIDAKLDKLAASAAPKAHRGS